MPSPSEPQFADGLTKEAACVLSAQRLRYGCLNLVQGPRTRLPPKKQLLAENIQMACQKFVSDELYEQTLYKDEIPRGYAHLRGSTPLKMSSWHRPVSRFSMSSIGGGYCTVFSLRLLFHLLCSLEVSERKK